MELVNLVMKSVESITECVDFENKTFCLPFCLLKMRGGVNVFDTPEEIIKNTYLLFFPLSHVCSIQSKMWSKKYFQMIYILSEWYKTYVFQNGITDKYWWYGCGESNEFSDRWPIRSTGDGVATNSKVGHVFWDQSVLHTPKYCYSAHTAFWNIKRLAPPKSMKVTKKTVFYENLHTAVKHFESSVKYKELLDDALKILIVKSLHLTSW